MSYISIMRFLSFFLPGVNIFDRLLTKSQRAESVSSTIHHLFREQATGKKKRERTRSALLDSAISVFASKGFEATRIIDITSHADMANGTFYNYYQDKDELLRDVATGLAVEITSRINDEMDGLTHGPTRVTLATARLLQVARREPEWLDVFLEGVFIVPELRSATVQYLRQDLEMGIEQGHFTININLLLVNQILSLIRAALLLDRDMSDDTLTQTCEAVLRLLGIPPGRAAKQVSNVFKRHLSGGKETAPNPTNG
jgi:AcrR family transcriptional regulator